MFDAGHDLGVIETDLDTVVPIVNVQRSDPEGLMLAYRIAPPGMRPTPVASMEGAVEVDSRPSP